ncbi:hypothetical protein Fmac_023682 [Flemingia macrophylla]|uniref:Eukaryotic translation initiation factor 5B n=1 Tax=Flemingia macrophylla TaxID=520843 RepID=A0ABD1LM83_9FABA
MGRKKPSARDDENGPQQGGAGKSKKKAVLIDDDEYAIGTELSEAPAPAPEEKPAGKKKGKKGNVKAKNNDDDDDADVNDDGDVPEVVFAGKKKGKNKKGGGSSGFTASGFSLLGDEESDEDEKSELMGEEDEDEPDVSFSGKKKPSKKSGGSLFTEYAFDAIDDGEEEDEPVVSFSGKKKSSKGSKKGGGSGSLFTASAYEAIDDDGDGEVVDDKDDDVDADEPVIAFTGKKKSSKGGKKGGSVFSAAVLGEIDDGEENKDEKEEAGDDDDDIGPITFSGKKKKSSKKASKGVSPEDDVFVSESSKGGDGKDEDDVSLVTFSGKKKSSKKKGSAAAAKGNDEFGLGSENVDVVEPEQPGDAGNSNANKSEGIAETSKNKKKNKKKSGRTAQEEEDLDKLLAELGETLPVPKPTASAPQEDKVQAAPDVAPAADASGENEGEEETVESAAAKKKKKKKEKEKEKKAAAAAAAAAGSVLEKETAEAKAETIESKKNESKTKAADKKVPKHVREMQEALARRKEAEERKKREEEERLRKEEEERRRQEELERQAEEARRRKKEREKEKLQKKKQEGKLLSGKQKEEARRLEAMRRQILNSTGGMAVSSGESGAPVKKPIYQTKKLKQNQRNQNGAAAQAAESVETQEATTDAASEEPEKIEEVESVQVNDEVEAPVAVEEAEVEDDEEDEWDAKSWDDVNLNDKGAFADEEADPEPVPTVKKENKSALPTQNAGTAYKTVSKPVAEEIENGKQANAVIVKKNNNREQPKSVVPPKPSDENLRSPICCIMGHVDTGKTKLLDCIRGTNVQEGEAGGITQQIGATYFPAENIRERTKELKADAKLKVPGLLVIDTPGHESFTNLRSRGSGLCDIAILVVDIMHGLEQQTIESLNLLKMRNTEFIVALNKVDRLYGWKTCRNAPIVKAMKQQTKDVQNEFNMRLTQIITQFKEQGLNTELYYKNKEMGETFSIVPTSAISGEGIPDLLLLLVQWTQKTMVEKLTYSEEVQCTVLEVKVVEGHGTTIDVVLVNGGPIVTTIRALLTPHPMKELRVKGTYLHHKEIKAAMGIKITAQGLEHAIAGTGLYVVKPDDDLEDVKESAMEDMQSVMSRIDRTVDILEGILKIGTPICIPSRDFIDIGRIASIENNHKPVDYAKKGQKVAIKIVGSNPEEQQKMFGRHFEIDDELVSHISRRSIDILKANYRIGCEIEDSFQDTMMRLECGFVEDADGSGMETSKAHAAMIQIDGAVSWRCKKLA